MKHSLLFIILLYLLLSLRFYFYYQDKPNHQFGNVITLETTLLNESKIVKNRQMIRVDSILIYTASYPRFEYGDKLKISGVIEAQEFTNPLTGKKTSQLIMSNPEIIREEEDLLAVPAFIRHKVQDTFNSVLPADESALLLGIIFGFRNNFREAYYDQLQMTGVLHVVAASGTNVTILAGVLLSSFAQFVKRKIALIFTITGVCIYAVIAGLDPPIVRASLMAMIALTAGLTGKLQYSLLALFVSGFVMLFVSPDLISSVGFQLSFLATFGIIVVKPKIDLMFVGLRGSVRPQQPHPNLLPQEKEDKKRVVFFEDLSTTLSAQITTIPILTMSFGSYSPVSVIVNMLLLWMIPLLMIVGGIAALLSLIWPGFALPFLYLCYPFLWLFKFVVGLFSGLAEATIVPRVNWWVIGGMYLIGVGLMFGKRRK